MTQPVCSLPELRTLVLDCAAGKLHQHKLTLKQLNQIESILQYELAKREKKLKVKLV